MDFLLLWCLNQILPLKNYLRTQEFPASPHFMRPPLSPPSESTNSPSLWDCTVGRKGHYLLGSPDSWGQLRRGRGPGTPLEGTRTSHSSRCVVAHPVSALYWGEMCNIWDVPSLTRRAGQWVFSSRMESLCSIHWQTLLPTLISFSPKGWDALPCHACKQSENFSICLCLLDIFKRKPNTSFGQVYGQFQSGLPCKKSRKPSPKSQFLLTITALVSYRQSEGTSVKILRRNSPTWPGSKVVGMMT